jgi:hypothetical protein
MAAAQTAPRTVPALLVPPGLVCSGSVNNGGGPNGYGCQIGPYELSVRGNLNIGGNSGSPTYSSGGGGSAAFDGYAINSRFRVTTSTTASTSLVVNFNPTYNGWQSAPACWVNPEQGSTTNAYAVATTAHVTLTWTGNVASAAFDILCIGTQVPTVG